MSYSQYGREGNLGPWISEIRYASTSAREFAPSSLGERWAGKAWNRFGAPLAIGLGGYGDTFAPGDLGLDLTQLPIIGPGIAAGIEAFKARTTGVVLSDPALQQAALQAGKSQASLLFTQYAPYLVAGLAAMLLLKRRRGRR